MRVFIAGGTGAIGTQLVPMLVEAGHEVIGATRSAVGADRLRAQRADAVRLDVFDRDAVLETVAAAAVDVVIHQLTSLGSADLRANARVRVEGTRNLVDAALQAGVPRMIAQSISFAYEGGSGPADESTPLDRDAPEPRRTSVAGVVALEETVGEMPVPVILRFGTFYGPGTWYAPGGRIAGLLAKGAVPANDGVSSFLHVRDAAEATIAALDWPGGPVNIVDDEPAPAREWVPVLAEALGQPVPDPQTGGAAWERGATNAYARTLGWTPAHPTWRTGFADQ
jgi:nucleoside-diphosphate-sugar epimerase